MQGQDTSSGLRAWLDRNVMDLGRQMRWSYLPPLMVYVAAGVSGLTGIVGTFFVKEYLGLSAAFLAALGFWAGIPWALKMPLGHLVDLLWRFKGVLVFVGAGLITASLSIMLGLLTERAALEAFMPVDAWYVASVLLAPIGYVLQDVVADAMTVEAVPRVDAAGEPIDPAARKLMHTTMQTLGRIAIIGGGVFVSLLNVYVFEGVAIYNSLRRFAGRKTVFVDGLAASMASGESHDAAEAGRRWALEHAAELVGIDVAENSTPASTPGAWLAKVGAVLDLLDRWGYQPTVSTADAGRTAQLGLHHCPLRQLAVDNPAVACGVHRGVIVGTLQALGERRAEVELVPFVEPDLCIARVGTATPFPDPATVRSERSRP